MSIKVQKLIESFLSDVTIVIPEQADGCIHVRNALAQDPDGVIREMVGCLGSHDEAIVARDSRFLTEHNTEILPGICLGKYWNELSNSSKDTVWKYLNLMLLAGAKHVRALDRKRNETTQSESTQGETGQTTKQTTDITSEIAQKLRDPTIRDKIMATIQETMASIPDEDETDDTTNSNPMDKLKMIENVFGNLKDTQLGKIVEEIAAEISGEISPEALGLPAESDLKSMKPQDLLGLFSKPELLSKIMKIVSRIGTNLNKRMESGTIDKEELAREGKEVLSKSQDLLKSLSPQVAKMMSSLQGGNGGMSSRKIARAMDKMDLGAILGGLGGLGGGGGGGGIGGKNSRESATRERLRKKISERQTTQGQTPPQNDTNGESTSSTATSTTTTTSSTSTKTTIKGKQNAKKKNSKKHH